MNRKYVWIAYTIESDEVTARVRAVAKTREELTDMGDVIEGPVPADMYPIGKVFNLDPV